MLQNLQGVVGASLGATGIWIIMRNSSGAVYTLGTVGILGGAVSRWVH